MEAVSPMRKIVRSIKGQTLIELTLIFPLMLALVYGAVEVGSVISTYLTITHTTREGANLISRGIAPNTALDGVIAAADPTIRTNNQSQWRVIYSQITQTPGTACPPKPCNYMVSAQTPRGSFGQSSKIGTPGNQVLISMGDVNPGQTFHAIEVYYDYTPNVMTYVGSSLINKTFYERSIFTDVK
jgi:TadE-like protein